jgi:hypothetical protein
VQLEDFQDADSFFRANWARPDNFREYLLAGYLIAIRLQCHDGSENASQPEE